MTVVQPKTMAESLSRRITDYQYEKSVPDLVLRGFKRDANKLKDISPAHAYHFLGQIAALEHNAKGVIENYDTALKYDSDSALYYNYAVSLMKVGRHELALKKLKEGFDLLDNNVSLTIAYLHSFSAFLSLSYLKKIVSLLEKYRVEYPKMIQEILGFFEKNEVKQHILEELMVDIRDVVYSCDLLFGPSVKYEEFANSLNISLGIEHFNDLEQIFDCNYKISEVKINLEDKYNVDLGDVLISCEVSQ